MFVVFCSVVHDKKVLGVCGETTLSTSKQFIITIMQIYEYFISHHIVRPVVSRFFVSALPTTQASDYSQNRIAYEEPAAPRRGSLLYGAPTETLPDAQDATRQGCPRISGRAG